MMQKQAKKGRKQARVSQSEQIEQVAKPTKRAKTRTRSRAKAQAKEPRTRREYSTNPDSQYLTPAEIDAVFAAIRSPRDRAIFRIVYHRGLRSHEPGLLQLSDWNERDGLLFIRRGKNSISRDYRLTAIERTALRAWLKVRGRAPGPLFPSRQKRARGLGIHRNRLDQLFRGYCRAAGIRPEKSHMHALKHSCGTHLSERGESAEVIQDFMGHRAASSTQIYMHFSQRRRDEAAARLENWR
jgi:integrase